MTDAAGPLPSPSPPKIAETNRDEQLAADPAMLARHQPDVEIHGTCAEQFSRVRDAFIDFLTNGQDIGASVAVVMDGEPVIDLWGGYFDDTYTRPWSRDTIANGFSSTKTMTALCALLLADRGELDLDAPVADYWPEFSAAGKAGVRVRQLLGHTSGLAGWTEHMTLDDIYDKERSTQLLAQQEPWWEPGTAAGYHGFTQGHLVGEVVRRVTGKPLGTFLTDEVTTPLGVAQDYYIGTPEEADPRVSLLTPGFRSTPAEPVLRTCVAQSAGDPARLVDHPVASRQPGCAQRARQRAWHRHGAIGARQRRRRRRAADERRRPSPRARTRNGGPRPGSGYPAALGHGVLPEQRNRACIGQCPRRALGWRRWLHVVRRSRPPLQLRLRPQPMDHRRTRAGPQPPPPNQFYLAL
jgi:CubicO group peptidase (beta-lactamase class C family)